MPYLRSHFSRKPVVVSRPGICAESQHPVSNAADFARLRLSLVLDPRQDEVLRTESRRAILNCSRQWGKSSMAAIKAFYRAYTLPDSLVVIASPSQRQSNELVRKVSRILAALRLPIRSDGGIEASLLFPNRSRVIGLPAKEDTVRGFSAASLVLIDEAALMDDEMYHALRPMLAVTDGDLWLMSTPQGRTGFFYDAWTFGGDEWLRISVPGTDCPRISARFLEDERASKGPVRFAREYLCEFTDTGREVFGRGLVEDALVDDSGWDLR